jgi:hypothetical protein
MKDIAVGEEITSCYIPDSESLTRLERQEQLPFECRCKASEVGTTYQRASDMRQRLIRGLLYLTSGGTNALDDRADWVIADPVLKDWAENFEISVASRIIYYYLTAFLLEEGGLMDEWWLESIELDLSGCIMLSDRTSFAILDLAAAQATWWTRLCVVCHVWGRKDVMDRVLAARLRKQHGLSPWRHLELD